MSAFKQRTSLKSRASFTTPGSGVSGSSPHCSRGERERSDHSGSTGSLDSMVTVLRTAHIPENRCPSHRPVGRRASACRRTPWWGHPKGTIRIVGGHRGGTEEHHATDEAKSVLSHTTNSAKRPAMLLAFSCAFFFGAVIATPECRRNARSARRTSASRDNRSATIQIRTP